MKMFSVDSYLVCTFDNSLSSVKEIILLFLIRYFMIVRILKSIYMNFV